MTGGFGTTPGRNAFADLVRAHAGSDAVLPIVRRLDPEALRAAGIDPLGAFALLAGDATHAALLETAEAGSGDADVSIVAANPQRIFAGADALEQVRELVADRVIDIGIDLPPFVGGAIGMLGHEHAARLEPMVPLAEHHHPITTPDAAFVEVGELLVFEHAVDRVLLVTTVDLRAIGGAPSATEIDTLHAGAVARLDAMELRLAGPLPAVLATPLGDIAAATDAAYDDVAPNMQREAFESMVTDARELIHAGEVVQVVVSQRFDRTFTADPLLAYRALRTVAPAPYHALLRLGDVHLVGASPEQLVGVHDGIVVTHPIAGTRRRGVDEADDLALERELLADPKERAEHMMLVDLGRNDVGRTCVPGSVEVTRLAQVERFSHVMHIVSRVAGRLRPDRHPVDALAACFPAGTLTGAPKVRALQLIAQLERDRRGAYGGIVGYVGHGRVLDAAITIRTATLGPDGTACVQAGAGIVAASQPELEYAETRDKARAALVALELAQRAAGRGAAVAAAEPVSIPIGALDGGGA